MKFTLLEIVQDILNDISGDSVDSISDTIEATQVANIVRSTYFFLISQKDIPEHKTFFQLEETSASTPTLMTVPDDVIKTYWIDYDVKHEPGAFAAGTFSGDAFDVGESSLFSGGLMYCPLDEFFVRMGSLKWDGTSVESYTWTTASGDVFDIKYRTDASPLFYTVLEDHYILFNSIDTDISPDYLEADLSWCYGLKKPTFTLSDGFTPDLDATEFNLLIEEAKAAASVKLRQAQDPKAEKRSRMGWIRLNSQAENVKGSSAYSRIRKYGRHK